MLNKLKSLGEVIDLHDPAEVNRLAALVPMMKSDGGGTLAYVSRNFYFPSHVCSQFS